MVNKLAVILRCVDRVTRPLRQHDRDLRALDAKRQAEHRRRVAWQCACAALDRRSREIAAVVRLFDGSEAEYRRTCYRDRKWTGIVAELKRLEQQ
jgi:hypothetical protein